MPKWLEKKLREGGADNPFAVMNAAGIDKGDSRKTVSRKMGQFANKVHRRKRRAKKRGATAGQAAKALVASLALLLLAPLALAQQPGVHHSGNFAYNYDVASSSLTYCKLTGQRTDPFGSPFSVAIPIETSGSSTTVSAVTASSEPFAQLAVGDVILVTRDNNSRDIRVITAKASDDQVTVDTAVDWSDGFPFSWLDLTCGTAATDGWIRVSDGGTVQLTVQYDAGDLDTLDVAWFCKEGALGSSAIRVYPGPSSDCGDGTLSGTVCTFATPGQGLSVKIPNNAFAQCRIGLKYGSTDGGTREQVTATVSVGR